MATTASYIFVTDPYSRSSELNLTQNVTDYDLDQAFESLSQLLETGRSEIPEADQLGRKAVDNRSRQLIEHGDTTGKTKSNHYERPTRFKYAGYDSLKSYIIHYQKTPSGPLPLWKWNRASQLGFEC